MRPIHFEVATYVMFGLTVAWIAVKHRDRREYWYALFGCTLLFPFEWIADKYWMFLDYDWGFVMMVDRLPLMMPFSWGWFFGLPLILCLRLENRIDALPPVLRVLLLFTVFFLWDVFVEYSSTSFHLWDYHWKKEAMIGGLLPWAIPIGVSFGSTLLYFFHKIALKKSKNTGWTRGFSIHVAAYYAVFIIQGSIGWSVMKLLDIQPFFGK